MVRTSWRLTLGFTLQAVQPRKKYRRNPYIIQKVKPKQLYQQTTAQPSQILDDDDHNKDEDEQDEDEIPPEGVLPFSQVVLISIYYLTNIWTHCVVIEIELQAFSYLFLEQYGKQSVSSLALCINTIKHN